MILIQRERNYQRSAKATSSFKRPSKLVFSAVTQLFVYMDNCTYVKTCESHCGLMQQEPRQEDSLEQYLEEG